MLCIASYGISIVYFLRNKPHSRGTDGTRHHTFYSPGTMRRLPFRRKSRQVPASRPGIGAVIGIVLCMLFSIPMMNLIIEWNESIILPEALSNIENWLKAQEASAQEMTRHMLQMSNIGDLTIMILIVGVLTGIGEEFVFRGIVQRLFLEKFRNRHIAVWTTAIIFSAIHFQFYGFVPRMLLGAFFGYLLVWSGNIWLPVTAHALNNSLSVIGAYIWGTDNNDSLFDAVGTSSGDAGWIVVSTSITVIMIWILQRRLKRQKDSKNLHLPNR